MKSKIALANAIMMTLSTMIAYTAQAKECKCIPAAQLSRVTEGVFSLKLGESMDLTEAGILLAFRRDYYVKKRFAGVYNSGDIEISINGRIYRSNLGSRYNLKKDSSRLSNRDECWLDVYRIVRAKGAPVTASFRLDCP